MAKKEKVPTVRLETPVGRLINNSFFEKDIYKDEDGREADPSYKIELAIDPDEEGLDDFETQIVDLVEQFWGKGAVDDYWDGGILCLRSGDDIAKERDKRGKPSDAYVGQLILRGSTVFNRDGQDAPGGIYVCDEDAEELDFAEKHKKVYNGCYGKAVVQAKPYELNKRRGIKFYLQGFQFVKDGEKLRTSDPSTLFKPLGRKPAEGESKGRRGRR